MIDNDERTSPLYILFTSLGLICWIASVVFTIIYFIKIIKCKIFIEYIIISCSLGLIGLILVLIAYHLFYKNKR